MIELRNKDMNPPAMLHVSVHQKKKTGFPRFVHQKREASEGFTFLSLLRDFLRSTNSQPVFSNYTLFRN